jgi:hypothetical protein
MRDFIFGLVIAETPAMYIAQQLEFARAETIALGAAVFIMWAFIYLLKEG